MNLYNSGRYCGIVGATAHSIYAQEFDDAISFAGTQLGLVTEDTLLFISTENDVILTTEG